MDKINADSAALSRAVETLNTFKNEISANIASTKNKLDDTFDNLDDNYKDDLRKFFDELEATKKKVSQFCEQNTKAINERNIKINEYSKTAYGR